MRAVLEGHEGAVNGVACFVGADGKPRIVSASDDKTVRVWNPSSGEEEAVLGMNEAAFAVCVSEYPDAQDMVIVSQGRSFVTLDIQNGIGLPSASAAVADETPLLQHEIVAGIYKPPRLVGEWINVKTLGLGKVLNFSGVWNRLMYDSPHLVDFVEHGQRSVVLRRRKFSKWVFEAFFHSFQNILLTRSIL